MSFQLTFDTTPPQALSSPKQSVRASVRETVTRLPSSASSSNLRSVFLPTNNSPARATPSTRFAPFDDKEVNLPRWQILLDDHFTHIFHRAVQSHDRPPPDDTAMRALRIIGVPTRAKAHGLAMAVYTHWVRIQSHSKDSDTSAMQVVALASEMVVRLGQADVQAQKHFVDQLNCLCIEKLHLTWRWYTTAPLDKALPIPRQALFTQIMSVITVISRLFHAGLFHHAVVLKGMKHIATTLPWPDAVEVIYTFMHKLGPGFALESAGWQFIQHLLAEILSHTANRPTSDPICRLVSAINKLLAEWHDRTSVTLYHT